VALSQRSVLRIVDGGPQVLDLEALLPSIATGDTRAFARFYEATSGLLFGLLLLILGDTATAETVLSQVYAEVSQHASRFDKNHDSLLIWLITITHRRALEHLCSSSGDQQFAESVGLADQRGPSHLASFGISKSAHRRLVGATLNGLSPTERRMIELAYFSRMTPRAIAVKLRQPLATTKISLRYGIAQLYNLFKNQGLVSGA
jgi:RNA polymerase sigma-70 factor (ECF subfamily)